MKIAVTGVGLTTSLALGAGATWERLVAGASGIGAIRGFDAEALPVRDGAEAPRLPDEPADRHERALGHLVRVGREALADAALDGDRAALDDDRAPSRDRIALVLGSSLAASASSPAFWREAATRGLDAADPTLLRAWVAEPLVDHVARELDVMGETLLVSNACAAGASSVTLAADLLRLGRADVAIAAGFDALDLFTLAGFASLKALASGPVRPFGLGRDGMKLGDGFAALVLEPEERARARGRTPLARLLGSGESADAHHITHPEPEGRGASLAIERALAASGLLPEAIDYVNAHATATGPNDAAELAALRRVFGERLASVPISATKAALGHTLGGAGAVAAVVTTLVLRHQHLPPTLGLGPREPGAEDIDLVPAPRPARVERALTSSFGFGGSNTVLVFERVTK